MPLFIQATCALPYFGLMKYPLLFQTALYRLLWQHGLLLEKIGGFVSTVFIISNAASYISSGQPLVPAPQLTAK